MSASLVAALPLDTTGLVYHVEAPDVTVRLVHES
jgi:hypothetical protein